MDDRFTNLTKVKDLLLPYLPHIAVLAVVGGLGALAATHTLMQPVPDAAAKDRWTLPEWKPYRAGPLREQVIDAQLWGDTPGAKTAAKAEAAAAAVPPWRFVGTVQEGSKRMAVIEIEGLHIQRKSAGDDLPNGAHIEAVGPGAMTYAENGTSRTLKLFDAEKKPNLGTAKGK